MLGVRLNMTDLREGFTLIELSLSIAFIAILSITMVLMINESLASYRRGITLNQINTTGMDLVDDMRAAVQNSTSRSIKDNCAAVYSNVDQRNKCENDGGYGFVSVERTAAVTGGVGTVPVFGAFCTGNYSYIWNSGYYFMDDMKVDSRVSMASLKYKRGSGATVTTASGFKLLKVKDDTRKVCIAAMEKDKYNYSAINNVIDLTSYEVFDETEIPTDILAAGTNNNLAIYDLSSARPATSSALHDIFYAVSFILGTVQGGINVNASGNFCATPEGYDSAIANFDYCAINKFNFAAQAMGG